MDFIRAIQEGFLSGKSVRWYSRSRRRSNWRPAKSACRRSALSRCPYEESPPNSSIHATPKALTINCHDGRFSDLFMKSSVVTCRTSGMDLQLPKSWKWASSPRGIAWQCSCSCVISTTGRVVDRSETTKTDTKKNRNHDMFSFPVQACVYLYRAHIGHHSWRHASGDAPYQA